jgi:hypothetical protein
MVQGGPPEAASAAIQSLSPAKVFQTPAAGRRRSSPSGRKKSFLAGQTLTVAMKPEEEEQQEKEEKLCWRGDSHTNKKEDREKDTLQAGGGDKWSGRVTPATSAAVPTL